METNILYLSINCIYKCLWIQKILEKLKIKKLINISLVLAIFVNIIWIIKNHPYQYAYYNSIILNKNLRNYELDYYGVSNLDNLKKIISVNKNNLSSIYTFSVNPYYLSLNLLNEEDKKKFPSPMILMRRII